jgi:hypothetical protein
LAPIGAPRRVVGLFVAGAAWIAIATCPSYAAGAKFEVDPGDDPLVITGFVGEEAPFRGTIRLRALERIPALRALFSDLRSDTDPTEACHAHTSASAAWSS